MNGEQTQAVQAEPSLLPVVAGPEAEGKLAALEGGGGRFRTNLPLSEKWAGTWLLKVSGIPSWRLENLVDQRFRLCYFHAKVVPVTLKESGEIVPRVMVTWFNDEGKTVAWTSEIATSKFGDILAAFGQGPWDPPLEVTIKAHPAKGGAGHWYYFDTPALPRPKRGGK